MFKSLSATTIALISIVAWSFIPVISKLGQLNIDNLQFLFWSNLLSAIVVAFTIKPNKKEISYALKHTNHLLTLILGFLGCFFYYMCLYYGYANANATQVLIIQYLWPALIPIFAMFILKERLNIYKIISIILGFIAAVIVFTNGNSISFKNYNLFALFVVFVGAISFALFSTLSKLERRVNLSFSVFLYFFWATIFSFISMLIWSKFIIPDIKTFILILINGAFINGLTYILWIYALSKEDASKIAPLVYLSPVLSLFWIAIIFKSNINILNIIAIVLVVASGLLVTLEDRL